MSYKSHKIHGTVDMSGDVYWKLYKSSRGNGFITVICLQWFDENDYYEDRFIKNSQDEIHVFETEEMAIEKLNEWYKPDEIDPEYRRSTIENLVRD